eukprot:8921429-Alexandrium_andersonii.AAC.1
MNDLAVPSSARLSRSGYPGSAYQNTIHVLISAYAETLSAINTGSVQLALLRNRSHRLMWI